MASIPPTGGCQCGAVRYRLSSLPTGASICHCRMCQKAFGSYVAPLAGVPLADLAWTRGALAIFRSSEAVERGFCRECGTPLTYRVLGADRISVSLGSLDDPDAVLPAEAFGLEGKRPIFDRLHILRGSTTGDGDDIPPELLARMKSRQHPDHDTETWPPPETRPPAG